MSNNDMHMLQIRLKQASTIDIVTMPKQNRYNTYYRQNKYNMYSTQA